MLRFARKNAPSPQVAEQAQFGYVPAPKHDQLVTVQLTLHGSVLHETFSASAGQLGPFVIINRKRSRLPPPQDALQLPWNSESGINGLNGN